MKLSGIKKINPKTLGLIIFFTGLLVRVSYSYNLPVTNDEGSYLYDAFNINQGLIPLKDFLTKSLPLIYTLAGAIKILGNSLTVGRFISIFVSFISSIFIYLIGGELFNKRVGLIASGLFWAFPSIAAYTILVHTEPFQVTLILISTYLIVKGLRLNKLSSLYLAGLLVGGAFFVRQSSLAYLVWIIFYIFIIKRNLGKYKKPIASFGTGFISVTLPLILITYKYIGSKKIFELIGGGAARMAVEQKPLYFPLNLPAYLLERIIEFFGESGVIYRDGLFLSILAIFFLILLVIYKFNITKRKRFIILLFLISTLSSSILFLQARFSFYTVLWKMMFLLMIATFSIFALFFLLSLLIYIENLKINILRNWKEGTFFLIGWTAFLCFLYLLWIKFRSPYLIEFFPMLVLFAASSVYLIIQISHSLTEKFLGSLFRFSLVAVFSLTLILSYFWNLKFPFTGLHTPKEVEVVVKFLKENTEPGEEILTASLIFPFSAGNKVPFNISHPSWYGYQNIDKQTLELFFPSFPNLFNYVKRKKVRYIINDPFTQSSYFKLHKDFSDYVEENYDKVLTVGRAEILKLKEKI